MPPRSRADKSRSANLQKGREAVSVIIFLDTLHSVPRIELLRYCQKFLDDSILLLSLYAVRSYASPDAITHFMEILGGAELHFSPETSHDLMLLTQEFGYNNLITRLVPQRDFPRHERNGHKSFQELDRSPRSTTIEAEVQSIRDGFADVQRRLSMIEEQFDDQLETCLSELEKMTELVKQPSQKRPSNQ
jgi:hypothetical protein